MKKEMLEAINRGRVDIFYKSPEWLRKRSSILKRDHNECQECKAEGSYSKADCVHHIKHLREFPLLALADENLISLCNVCHNIKHPEKLHREYKRKYWNEERW